MHERALSDLDHTVDRENSLGRKIPWEALGSVISLGLHPRPITQP